MCLRHGKKAKLKWKPIATWRTGPEGRKIKTVSRKYSYKCDVDDDRGRGLGQLKLSFTTDVSGNTKKGYLGTSKIDASKGTKSTAGPALDDRNVVDEKDSR